MISLSELHSQRDLLAGLPVIGNEALWQGLQDDIATTTVQALTAQGCPILVSQPKPDADLYADMSPTEVLALVTSVLKED